MAAEADAGKLEQRLQALRARHATQSPPIALTIANALFARSEGQAPDVQARLHARIAGLLDGMVNDAAQAPAPTSVTATPLAGLIEHVLTARQAAADSTAASEDGANDAWPDLPGLEEVRQLWTEVRADSQLRQSLQLAPENGGPLNSGVLVNRTLKLMRDVSPAYLRHFLAYIDNLAWLDQLRQSPTPSAEGQRTAPARKRASRKRAAS